MVKMFEIETTYKLEIEAKYLRLGGSVNAITFRCKAVYIYIIVLYSLIASECS